MTIDVHGHITSPALFDRYPMPRSLADIDGMIEAKAALGVTTTIVGSPVGAGTMIRVPGQDNYAQPLAELATFHDWIGEQVRARPGQLKAYVYTDPYGEDALLEMAARLLEQEEFVGLIVNSSIRGEYLDSPRADSFFALAAERRVPILLHPPAEPAGGARLRDFRLVEHVARPCDVATGVAAILFAGWLEKYPDLSIVAPTAGGGLAALLEKLEIAFCMPKPGPPRPRDPDEMVARRPPAQSLGGVYVDSSTPSRAALAAALDAFGADHVLFGTDSPPLSTPLSAAIDQIGSLGLTAEDEALVRRGNAMRLFGLDSTIPEYLEVR